MNERLKEQLEEMEKQLSLLESAISALNGSKAAAEETTKALHDAQAGLSEACSGFLPEVGNRFDEFAERSNGISDALEELLANLKKLDAGELASLLSTSEANMAELANKNLEEFRTASARALENAVAEFEQSEGFSGLHSRFDQQDEMERRREKEAAELEARIVGGLNEGIAGLRGQLDASNENIRRAIEEARLYCDEGLEKLQRAIKLSQIYGLIAVGAASVAVIASVIGVFL